MPRKTASNTLPARHQAEGQLEQIDDSQWLAIQRAAQLVSPFDDKPLSLAQAKKIADRLGINWRTVYRYRDRLSDNSEATAIKGIRRGWKSHRSRLSEEQERAIQQAVTAYRKRRGPIRVVDFMEEVAAHCRLLQTPCPSRPAVERRLRKAMSDRVFRRGTVQPGPVDPKISPGTFHVVKPLAVVQIDHTPMDLVVVDDLYRQPLGKPYLTLAVDVATRGVLGFVISFVPPGAATVSLCLTVSVASKTNWLRQLEIPGDWPMAGLPKSIHLDGAAEFHSKALLRGCGQYGIEVVHRARPHHGGHIERLLGTKMSKLKELPGYTGGNPKARRTSTPEADSALTLAELERWFIHQIVGRYHNEPHRGLRGGTPNGAWNAHPRITLPVASLKRFRITFLPAVSRTLRREGVTFQHLRYWHPIFTNWLSIRGQIVLHYDPRDLSRLYVKHQKDFIEIPYSDIRLPAVSLWESQAAARHLREAGRKSIHPTLLVETIETQRAMIQAAQEDTRTARRKRKAVSQPKSIGLDPLTDGEIAPAPDEIDWTSPAKPYEGEVWSTGRRQK